MLLFLKNLLFTVVVPGTVAGYGPWLIARGCGEPFGSPAWLLLASGFFIVGGMIYLGCVWDFATFGQGTPAPINPPKKLVVRGLGRGGQDTASAKMRALQHRLHGPERDADPTESQDGGDDPERHQIAIIRGRRFLAKPGTGSGNASNPTESDCI